MSFRDLKVFIKSDLFRYFGKSDLKTFFRAYFIIPGFKFMFWFRIGQFFFNKNRFLYYLLRIKNHFLQIKYGIQIPLSTKIGKGFYIGHFGGIVISGNAVIGDNCNISHNITIGYSPRGFNKGIPVLGNNVYIGPGSIVIGKVLIGDDVAIGSNSVVTKNIENKSVVVGIPGKVISFKGSYEYILNKYL